MQATLNSLHHQGNDWKRELEFYVEELAILTGRLEEVTSKNKGKETLQMVEHFQNKFILLREEIDDLRDDIKEREETIEKVSKDKPGQVDKVMRIAGDRILERMTALSKNIAESRYEFNHFLAKVM